MEQCDVLSFPYTFISRKSTRTNRCHDKSYTAYLRHLRPTIHATRGASERARSLARLCWRQEVSAGRVRLISRSRCERSDTLRCASSRVEVKSQPRADRERIGRPVGGDNCREWSLIIIKGDVTRWRESLVLVVRSEEIGSDYHKNATAARCVVWQPVAAASRREDAPFRVPLRRIRLGTSWRAVRRFRSHCLSRTGRPEIEGQGPWIY